MKIFKSPFRMVLYALSAVQIVWLMEFDVLDSILAMAFQGAPHLLGFSIGVFVEKSTGRLSSQIPFHHPVAGLMYAGAIYMIGLFFFVLLNGGGLNEIVKDSVPYEFIFPHPTFLFLGIVTGMNWVKKRSIGKIWIEK